MRLHTALVAAGSLAVAVTLVPAASSAADVSPLPLPMPSQQPTVAPARPVVGGHHVQPDAALLQDEGVQGPTRQQTQDVDRLAKELLEQAKTKSGAGDE
jgi:hypothetical protein